MSANPYIDHFELMQPMIAFSQTVAAMGLEPSLQELVKVRASQLNGCGVCLHMHYEEARRAGERDERLFMLDAWRETSLYSERERAALAWTEALTRIADGRRDEAAEAAVEANFTPEERVKLALVIALINAFNRIGVGFHLGPIDLAKARKAA